MTLSRKGELRQRALEDGNERDLISIAILLLKSSLRVWTFNTCCDSSRNRFCVSVEPTLFSKFQFFSNVSLPSRFDEHGSSSWRHAEVQYPCLSSSSECGSIPLTNGPVRIIFMCTCYVYPLPSYPLTATPFPAVVEWEWSYHSRRLLSWFYFVQFIGQPSPIAPLHLFFSRLEPQKCSSLRWKLATCSADNGIERSWGCSPQRKLAEDKWEIWI